ncbi:MAG: UxaA family hydrolase [Treponema sp.]|nr:UxaA family hydrolase [Treponema sp.]
MYRKYHDFAMARIIKVHPLDNTAISVNHIIPGEELAPGLIALDEVAQGQKIALQDLSPQDELIRYGVALGKLNRELKAGSRIDDDMLEAAASPSLQDLSWTPPPQTEFTFPSHLHASFEGYLVPGAWYGGVRNILCIMTSVQCVSGVVQAAAEKIRRELLPRYPQVDDIAIISHQYGCGVAIEAPGAEIPIRSLKNLMRNPNFGGEIMLITLGCEKLEAHVLLDQDELNPEHLICLQEQPGYSAMIEAIYRMADKKLAILNERRRVSLSLSRLAVGFQCGGSDAFSGVTCNPAAGHATDLLVAAGAAVMFSEVTEVRDAAQVLAARCTSPQVLARLIEELTWYDAYLRRGGADTSANPSPGNKSGGISNIVEKTLGAIVKSGSFPISCVLGPGERLAPPPEGTASSEGSSPAGRLVFASTPASDFVCGPLQLASGAVLQVFSTGRGTPYGLAAAPVIKMSSRSALKEQWNDLIDFDAGAIAEGEESIAQAGERLFQLILDTASGRYRPLAEQHRIYNDICILDPAPLT